MSRSGDHRVQRMRPLPARRPVIVSVLDVGTSKICCIIARLTPRAAGDVLPGRTHAIEVLGFGYQRSRGIKAGAVVDLDQAEKAIRLAVDAAERMAGLTVESLIVSLSCGRLGSETFSAGFDLSGREVGEADIQRVLEAGSEHTAKDGRAIVHALPIGYALDGNRGIRDPRGMLGQRLSVDTHMVSADSAPVRNLEICINRAHLEVETMVATPYASGLAALVDDESQLGVACVDIGGGTTKIAVFADGQFVHVDGFALGGHHVTMDLARGLSARLVDAERLKTLHGSVIATDSDERDMVTVEPVGDDDVPSHVPRSQIVHIIRPRAEEILEVVRDRLHASGFAGRVGRRIVLTGGASQLTGLTELARKILGRNVRLGRPVGIAGLPEAARGSAFATGVGLLIYPQVAQIEQFTTRRKSVAIAANGGFVSRVGQWFRESF
ncbi:cell division protein FtsA [Chthonobacter rhizosphaerae]|uniref:cell division protein FtsA n=1 Tax=Chthonobacter rhizosphaerae TaxID=2735553 RepID=UPI0015EED8FC|nr:cell division protein FtsA [Chthonobacter rhizosphaerae]